MSAPGGDDKMETNKSVPLDLAAKLAPVKTIDVKPPLIVTGPSTIRSMRVVTSATPGQSGTTIIMPTIKQGIITTGQPGTAGSIIQRPAQITLTANLPVVAVTSGGTPSYHVPRGPAVVANLAAPRSSAVATNIRTPLVVRDASGALTGGAATVLAATASAGSGISVVQSFVRPSCTPSSAQQQHSHLQTPQGVVSIATAGGASSSWLAPAAATITVAPVLTAGTGVLTGVQQGSAITSGNIKPATIITAMGVGGAPAGMSVRTATGAKQLSSNACASSSALTVTGSGAATTISAGTLLRPGATIVPIGTQIHTFKATSAGVTNIANTVTIAQVQPNRQHNWGAPRHSVPSSVQSHRQMTTVPRSVVTTRPTAASLTLTSSNNMVTSSNTTLPSPTGQTIVTSIGGMAPRLIGATSSNVTPIGATAAAVFATTNVRITSAQPQPSQHQLLAAGVASRPGSATGGASMQTTSLPVSSGAQQQILASGIVTSQQRTTTGQAVVALANVTSASQAPTLPRSINVTPANATLSLQPLMAAVQQSMTVSGASASVPKIITQAGPGTIHLTQMTSSIKGQHGVVTSRSNMNIKSTVVNQRTTSSTIGGAQQVQIAKVYPQACDAPPPTANVFIHTNVSNSKNSGPYVVSNQPMRFNTVAVLETTLKQPPPLPASNIATIDHTAVTMDVGILTVPPQQQQPSQTASSGPAVKPTTGSPRPSILRKRDNEGSNMKAIKNLASSLHQPQLAQQQSHSQSSLGVLSLVGSGLADSEENSRTVAAIRAAEALRDNGNSSEGSTTISASSSPGLADTVDDMVPMNIIKSEEENRPPMEMSPRKKPRKQNLTGNDLEEHAGEMQFISDHDPIVKKEQPPSIMMQQHMPEGSASDQRFLSAQNVSTGNNITARRDDSATDTHGSDLNSNNSKSSSGMTMSRDKPPAATLLNSYRHNWKTTHNHYVRYSDVKPKDERRPSIMDLSNQCRVLDKINGWKIHHLSTQMEDLADQEQTIYDQLADLLKCTESKQWSKDKEDKDVNKINELIKGNLQRIKIINDGMIEAKSQILKIFDHKSNVTDIISRCASKRNYKKREKVS